MTDNNSPSSAALDPIEVTIAADGDLYIRCGEDLGEDLCPLVINFQVSSRAVAGASGVWARMLEQREALSRDARGRRVLVLGEDDPEPMERVLAIIHGQTPSGIGDLCRTYGTGIFELASLAGKYDLTHMLRPWANHWAQTRPHGLVRPPFDYLWAQFDTGVEIEPYVCVAWELGDTLWFKQMMQIIAMRSSVDEDGDLVATEGVPYVFEGSEEDEVLGKLPILPNLFPPLQSCLVLRN
jgi:hypothetical protein